MPSATSLFLYSLTVCRAWGEHVPSLLRRAGVACLLEGRRKEWEREGLSSPGHREEGAVSEWKPRVQNAAGQGVEWGSR